MVPKTIDIILTNCSILSPSLDFLSQDQKITLAERSSSVAQPVDFNPSNDEPQKSQDDILKKYFHQHRILSTSQVDDGRNPRPVDDRRQVSSSENETLEEIQERMNHFQQGFDMEIKNQDEDNFVHEKKRRKQILWGSCIVIVLLVVIVSLTVSLVTQNSGEHNSISPNVSSSFRVEECYSENYFDPMRHNSFRMFLISYYPTLRDSIDTQGSSANLALCWLSQYDTLYQNPFPMHADALAQRFVLVILYFSLTQSRNGIPDSNVFAKRNWLSQQDVCGWTLVGCQNASVSFRYVTSLDFSDLHIINVSLPSEVSLLENLRRLNFNPIVFEGTIPLELSKLTNLEVFEVRVWGLESAYEVDKVIESWRHLEQLSLELSFSNPLPDFNTFTELKRLDVIDESLLSSYKFPDIQNLTKLGMHFHD